MHKNEKKIEKMKKIKKIENFFSKRFDKKSFVRQNNECKKTEKLKTKKKFFF